MRAKHTSTKAFAVALCVAISLSYAPGIHTPKAHALVGLDTADILSVPVKSFTEAAEKLAHTGQSIMGVPIPFTSLDSIMKKAAKSLLNQLNNNFVLWFNTGNESGQPAHVSDMTLFVNDVRTEAAKQYIAQNTGSTCTYFRDDLRKALELQYGVEAASGMTNSSTEGCEIEQNQNFNKFMSGDFIGGGGWDTWTELTQNDNNNPIGSYIKHTDEMNAAVNKKEILEREKLIANQGFRPATTTDKNGAVVDKIPGVVLKDQLTDTLNSSRRQLENVQSFDDIVTILADNLINRTIMNPGGLSDFTSANLTDTSDNHYKPNYEGLVQNVAAEQGQAQNIAPQGVAKQAGVSNDDVPHDAAVALTGSSNRNPEWGVAITEKRDNPWWYVNLSKQRTIDRIVVVPSYGDDFLLTNFYICISKTNPENTLRASVLSGTSVNHSCSTVFTPNMNNPSYTFNVDKYQGQYVSVQMQAANTKLAIAGVQVYAYSEPVITLLGNADMTLGRGGTFVDPGAVAVDDVDGNITSKMEVSGEVDTNTPGAYTLTYTVTNSQGIRSSPVTRSVVVR